jgi:formylglycine-generating enzyme required for sulfatase activity
MKQKHLTLLLLLPALLLSVEISNLTVAQRTDGSKLVDISYDLAGDSAAYTITVEYRLSSTAAYDTLDNSYLSGDMGIAVTPGTGKQIVWNAGASHPNISSDATQIRLSADGYNSAAESDNMIFIEGGSFTMGDTWGDGYSWEKPTHEVTLSSFYMSKYEVTQAEVAALLGDQGWESTLGVGDNYPAYYITWYEAVVYCNLRSQQEGLEQCYTINGTDVSCDFSKNGYRLPTEAEWEYAAGASATLSNRTKYAGTDDVNELGDYAWYEGNNSPYGSKEVGTKQPNALGLYDMSGNVWEWCWDWYGGSYYSSSPSNDPMGPASGSYRVYRGGGWDDYAYNCRVAGRAYNPSDGGYDLGFRVCLSSTAPTASYSYSPDSVTVGSVVTFDASGSSDGEDAAADLQVRWDFENDGTWDSDWSTSKTITHQFSAADTYIVILQVMDTDSLTHQARDTVIVREAAESDNMLFIEGGTFTMGDTWGDGESDERPTHQVNLSSFYMSKYEVTQAEYEAVMGSNPSYFSGANKPVEKVTWYNAVAYCNLLSQQEGLEACYTINGTTVTCDFSKNGYRLPTEAEWEYAAGGGSSQKTKYAGTDDVNELGNYAWFSTNSGSQTHEVGTKQPNALGLYDMSGNVWEWCWDWYGSYSSTAQTNPTGPASGSGRVERGGSWDRYASGCRVAFRINSSPSYSYANLGFRLVRRAL